MCSRSWGLHGLPAVCKFPTSRCPLTAPHSQNCPESWCSGHAGLCSPLPHAPEDSGCTVQVKIRDTPKDVLDLHRPRGPHEPKALPASRPPDGWQGVDLGVR